jgi:hypothetical protein
MRLLHLEDKVSDAFFIREALEHSGVDPHLVQVDNPGDYRSALEREEFDAVLVDNAAPNFNGFAALALAEEIRPGIAVIFVSGNADVDQIKSSLDAGAADYVVKGDPAELEIALHRVRRDVKRARERSDMQRHHLDLLRLVAAMQELSVARDRATLLSVGCRAARELAAADGATIALGEGGQCHYADEDAVSPLWKGQRFPLGTSVAGWAMQTRRPVVIEDLQADRRQPAEAAQPTFVSGTVAVPIRAEEPIGAIGCHWTARGAPSGDVMEMLQALAAATGIAVENVDALAELERLLRERSSRFEEASRELETFAYSVSHDLRAPVRHIGGFAELLRKDAGSVLTEKSASYLDIIVRATGTMQQLMDALLMYSRTGRAEMKITTVSLSDLAREVQAGLQGTTRNRNVVWRIGALPEVQADAPLLLSVLENLMSNAVKFTRKRDPAIIEVGIGPGSAGESVVFVRDNGAGFDPQYAQKLFGMFQRLHLQDDYEGVGVGLATVRRIISRHGGRTWAEGKAEEGATFYFSIPVVPA